MEEAPPTQEQLLIFVDAAITFYECVNNHELPEPWKVQELLMFARRNRTVIQDISACMEQVYAARDEKR